METNSKPVLELLGPRFEPLELTPASSSVAQEGDTVSSLGPSNPLPPFSFSSFFFFFYKDIFFKDLFIHLLYISTL